MLAALRTARSSRAASDEQLAGDAVRRASRASLGPLPRRHEAERVLGEDLSSVRSALGPDATAACDALGAQAFAFGNLTVFSRDPDLATVVHEAAHTVQQRDVGGPLPSQLPVLGPDASEEREARGREAGVAGRLTPGRLAVALKPKTDDAASTSASPGGAGTSMLPSPRRDVTLLDDAQLSSELSVTSGWLHEHPLDLRRGDIESYYVTLRDEWSRRRQSTTVQRSLQLWSLALNPDNEKLDIAQVERVIAETPDGQVQDLLRALTAGKGQLLNALKQNAKGDVVTRLGQAMTDVMLRSIMLGEADWALSSMLGQGEFEVPKGQPIAWAGDQPDWATNLQVWRDDRGGWSFFDEEHGLTQFDPIGKRISRQGFWGSDLIDRMRKDEQREEELRWTGGKRYVPGKGLLDPSQWRAHITERKRALSGEASRKIANLESGTKLWMDTQNGLAYAASAPSHLLGGRSFGEPAKIVAWARDAQKSALADMEKAVTPTEFDEAERKLTRVPTRADRLFYEYKEAVQGGGEATIVVIKGTAVVATAAVAAPALATAGGTALTLKGLGLAVGAGATISAGRQGVQLLAGDRDDFSVGEVMQGGAIGGGFYLMPSLGPLAMGAGVSSAADELSRGHFAVGTFDLLTTAGLPALAKGAPEAFTWAKPRMAAATMRAMLGVEEVPGLSGHGNASNIPSRPNTVIVDQSGKPISTGAGDSSNATAWNPSAFESVSSSTAMRSPYDFPVTINLAAKPKPNLALRGVTDVANSYGANPVNVSLAPDSGGSISGASGTAVIGTVDRYWRLAPADYLDPADLGPLIPRKIRATEGEHLHATKGVQQLLSTWSKGASPAIDLAEPHSRIKTPTDNKLTQALKDGTITPEFWLQQSRGNIYRSWFAARTQGIPVPTASQLAVAILQQEALMRARGVPINW